MFGLFYLPNTRLYESEQSDLIKPELKGRKAKKMFGIFFGVVQPAYTNNSLIT